METLCKIVIMVLFALTMGEDTDDIKEMMQDMNIRLYKAEDKLTEALNDLASTKHDLGVALNELAETKTKLMTTENDLATTNIALHELAKVQTETKTVLMKNDCELENENNENEKPTIHACARVAAMTAV